MNTDERRALGIIIKEYAPEAQNQYFEKQFRKYLKVKHEQLEMIDTAVEEYFPLPQEIVENFATWMKVTIGVTMFKKAEFQVQPQS
jgi:hypothetical protein